MNGSACRTQTGVQAAIMLVMGLAITRHDVINDDAKRRSGAGHSSVPAPVVPIRSGMDAAPKSLSDFAPPRTATTRCGACALQPEVIAELESCRLQEPTRFTYPVIARWLKQEIGAIVSEDTLRRHFRKHVS